MSSRAETKEVRRTMPGAKPLYDIYGFWPSLHDAEVREVRVDFAGRTIEIVVDYYDETEYVEQESNTAQRITLRWQGVTSSTLRILDDGIYHMDFTRRPEGLETVFEHAGSIVSASVEVTGIEPTPDPAETGDRRTVLSFS